MDWIQIKNLVKHNGDKFVFAENGEPEVVMMSFGEYQKLAKHSGSAAAQHRSEYRAEFANLGSEQLGETEFMAPMVAESAGLPVRLEDIRLEDLPI